MSTIRNPVGPQPPKTYWRRRLLVLIGVLAVILIIVLIVVRPGGSGTPTAQGTNTPASTAAGPSTETVKPCSVANVQVTAVTDKETYKAGENPQLSFTIENTGTTDCTFKVGTDVQKYVITSGSETIWQSTDCQTDAVAKTVTLKAGTPVSSSPFAWNRTRSSKTTCKATNPPQVTAGGASYHLGVTVDTATSAKTKQFVLN
jgi:hypothetical protein